MSIKIEITALDAAHAQEIMRRLLNGESAAVPCIVPQGFELSEEDEKALLSAGPGELVEIPGLAQTAVKPPRASRKKKISDTVTASGEAPPIGVVDAPGPRTSTAEELRDVYKAAVKQFGFPKVQGAVTPALTKAGKQTIIDLTDVERGEVLTNIEALT